MTWEEKKHKLSQILYSQKQKVRKQKKSKEIKSNYKKIEKKEVTTMVAKVGKKN